MHEKRMTEPENNPNLLPLIRNLVEDETDWIAILSTVICELHHAHPPFHWTGFYRVTEPGVLKVVAVLDIDSDEPAAFSGEEAQRMEEICAFLGRKFSEEVSC